MLISGALHDSRGALFPALKSIGLTDEEVRRAWAAMRYGAWQTETLLETWRAYVTDQGEWQAARYAGYSTTAVDITAYWRPTLKGLKSRHYHAEADKALPAVVFGMVGRVGRVGQQRMALLTDLIRADLKDPSKTALQRSLLRQLAENLAEDEMPVLDAGFKLKTLFQAGLERFVLRLATNFTARRNFLPEYEGGRPAEYGDIVRPLARSYDGKQIPATAPDRVETWQQLGLEFRAEFWDDLVLRECKPSAENQTFTVVAVYDPRFETPWLLACPLQLSGADFWGFYHDRWPIEQLPLASKHMVGAQRQFVSAEESCYRLPSYPCWPDPFRPIWRPPCLPSRPDFGIAIPKALQVAYAVGWAERLSQTCSLLSQVEFDESRRLQLICPRVFSVTGAQNSPHCPELALFRAFPKHF